MKKENVHFLRINVNSFKNFNNFYLRKKQPNSLNHTVTVKIPSINQKPNKKFEDVFNKKNKSFNTKLATQYIYNPLKIKNEYIKTDRNFLKNNSQLKVINEYFPVKTDGNISSQLKNNFHDNNIKIKLIKFNKNNLPFSFKNKERLKFESTYQVNNRNKNSDYLKYIENNGIRKFNPKNIPIKPNFRTLDDITYNQLLYNQKKNNTLDIQESKFNNYLGNNITNDSESSKDEGELSLGDVADIIIYHSFKKEKKEKNFLFYKNDYNTFKSNKKNNYLKFFL